MTKAAQLHQALQLSTSLPLIILKCMTKIAVHNIILEISIEKVTRLMNLLILNNIKILRIILTPAIKWKIWKIMLRIWIINSKFSHKIFLSSLETIKIINSRISINILLIERMPQLLSVIQMIDPSDQVQQEDGLEIHSNIFRKYKEYSKITKYKFKINKKKKVKNYF